MKKITLCVLIILFALLLYGAKAEENELSIRISVGECIYAVNILQSIDIYGEEIERFIKTKEFFLDNAKKAQNENKNISDELELIIPIETAQGFISFTSRAKIKGSDADLYYGIVQEILEAANSKKQEK